MSSRQAAVDHRLHPLARRLGIQHAHADGLGMTEGQSAEGGFQQTVLVLEVMRDEPGGNARAPGDPGQCRACKTGFGEAVDGHLDQLEAAAVKP